MIVIAPVLIIPRKSYEKGSPNSEKTNFNPQSAENIPQVEAASPLPHDRSQPPMRAVSGHSHLLLPPRHRSCPAAPSPLPHHPSHPPTPPPPPPHPLPPHPSPPPPPPPPPP